jgi:hypothetical protein
VEQVAVAPRDRVAVRGHGVEMPAEDDTPVATEVGAGDHVVADALDVETRGARTQTRLDHVGERALVVALRRDRHQLGGELEEIGHVAAPWSRRMSLSFDLS